MDWARLLHCNLGWSCEDSDHQICIFSKMWLLWCHKTICREFAPWFQFPQCAIRSTNCPLIKIRCDFPLFDHPEGSVPRWPLVLVTHRPPLGLMLSRWEACHLWPRSRVTLWPRQKRKKQNKKTLQTDLKQVTLTLVQNVSLDQRNAVLFFPRWNH